MSPETATKPKGRPRQRPVEQSRHHLRLTVSREELELITLARQRLGEQAGRRYSQVDFNRVAVLRMAREVLSESDACV